MIRRTKPFTSCPLDCPDACGAEVVLDGDGRLERLRGNRGHHWSKGSLCGKTAIYHELVNAPNRLLTPLVRRASGFEEASWDEALGVIARRMEGISGDDVLSLDYAGNMGLVQRRFPRRLMHALDATFHDDGVCDATAETGFQLVMGRSIGPDLDVEMVPERCDLFVLWGSDAKRTTPHLMQRLKGLAKAGTPIVVIDIYRTETMAAVEAMGGIGMVVHPGSDGALALGMAAHAFDQRFADLAYLKEECVGAAELRAELAGAWPRSAIESATGLEGDAIDRLGELLRAARSPLLKVGIGFARRRNGGENMRSIAALGAVLGHGDRIYFQSGDHFGLDVDCIARPDVHGEPDRARVSHVGLGEVLEGGAFRSAFVWGHNPAATLPNANAVRRGLARDDLFVVVHELFMTETARLADVVLPATALVEHSDLFRSYGHRTLQVGWRQVEPRGAARSNVRAFGDIGRALGFTGDAGHADEITGELFESGEDALVGALLAQNRGRFASSEEYRRAVEGEPVKLAPRTFPDRGTPSGRIELRSEEAARRFGVSPLPRWTPDDGAGMGGAFQLVSAPSTATHNSTYLHVPRHRERLGSPLAWLHPKDAAGEGIADGDPVTLGSEHGELTLTARLDDDVPRMQVRVDGFVNEELVPEGTCVNALVSPRTSDLGGGNVLYSTRVSVRRG